VNWREDIFETKDVKAYVDAWQSDILFPPFVFIFLLHLKKYHVWFKLYHWIQQMQPQMSNNFVSTAAECEHQRFHRLIKDGAYYLVKLNDKLYIESVTHFCFFLCYAWKLWSSGGGISYLFFFPISLVSDTYTEMLHCKNELPWA